MAISYIHQAEYKYSIVSNITKVITNAYNAKITDKLNNTTITNIVYVLATIAVKIMEMYAYNANKIIH